MRPTQDARCIGSEQRRAAALFGGIAAAFAALLAVASVPPAAEARQIGAVAAANPLIEGAPPSVAPRRLVVGVDVFENERILTSAEGSGQILFDDQTTLTVAPGSDIALDRYVYDPDAGSGQIGLSMTKGALRFIGGRLSKDQDAVVRTPTATIGIRGGMALIRIGEDGKVEIVNVAAAYVKIESTGETFFLSRQGATAEVGPDGEIVYLGLADSATLERFYAAFEQSSGGGGARLPPSDGDVVASGFPAVGSEEPGAPFRNPVSTEGGEPSEAPLLEPIVIGTDFLIERFGGAPLETPVVLILGTPLSATGSAFFAGAGAFTTFGGGVVGNPAFSGVFFTPTGAQSFVATFAGSRIGVTADGTVIRIPTPETRGAFAFDDGDGATAGEDAVSGFGFYDPIEADPESDFTLAVFSIRDGVEGPLDAIAAAVIGAPTPEQLLDVGVETPGGEILVRSYDLEISDSSAGRGARPFFDKGIVPDFVIAAGAPADNRLTIVGDPSGDLFGAAATVGATQGASKAALALFAVSGEPGVAQSSLFGGFAAPWRSNGDAPTLSAQLYATGAEAYPTAPLPPTEFRESIGIRVDVGTIEDGSAANNVFYGPDGEYLVLGTAGRFFESPSDEDFGDPDFDFGTGVAKTIGRDYTLSDDFGFIGFGRDPQDLEVAALDRIAHASVDPADLAVSANVLTGVTAVFTGGFYGGLRQTFYTGGAFVIAEPSAIERATDPSAVTAAFAPSTNSVAVAIDGPSHFGEGALVFGARPEASAFVDTKTFVAETRIAEDENADGFLASSGASGVPAIFPTGTETYGYDVRNGSGVVVDHVTVAIAGVDTTPEYATWGHWSHEIAYASEGGPALERTHAASWVAGDLARPDELPSGGVVRFAGHAEVSVERGGYRYIDGGGYHMAYDFDHDAGTASFRDLAGYDFDVDVAKSGDVGFTGAIDVGSIVARDVGLPDVTGGLDGAFFADQAGNGAAAAAGSIAFQGGDLTAAGTFVGDKIGHGYGVAE